MHEFTEICKFTLNICTAGMLITLHILVWRSQPANARLYTAYLSRVALSKFLHIANH